MNAQQANPRLVFVGVLTALAVGALPLLNKSVYNREQQIAELRDQSFDAKNAARDSRLSIRRRDRTE